MRFWSLTFIFVILLVLVSFAAPKDSKAQILGSSAIISGTLDNSSGTIPITVSVTFYSGVPGTPVALPPINPISYVVPAGSQVTASYTDLIDRGWYEISWSTSCSDPPALAISAIVPGAYNFPTQNVACQSPNATPAITNTACATVGWALTGVGVDGANIASFSVYESTNSSDLGPGDPIASSLYVQGLSPGARSYNFGFNQPNTYYMRIRAVSPQGVGSWSSVGQFSCGAAITPATGLSASPFCPSSGSGNIVAVNYSWSPASGGSTAQWLDYSVWNNGFAPGTYSNYSVNGATSFSAPANYAQGVTYYWRVNNQISGNWYPSVTASFTTPSCPVVTSPPPAATPTPTPGPVCPAGCTGPSNVTQNWGRPSGSASGTSINNGFTATCSSNALTCTLSGFIVGGDFIGWTASYGAAKLNTGTGATFLGSYNVSWGWTWNVTWCPVPDSTTTSCFANPNVVTTSNFSDSSSSPGYTWSGSSLTPNQHYAYQANIVATAGGSNVEYTRGNFQAGGCNCPTPVPTPTPVPPRITLTGYSDCVDGVNPLVHLTWSSNTGATGYSVYRDGGFVGSVGAVGSWNSPGAQPSGPHNWYVIGTGGSFSGTASNTISIITATCTPPPADPSNLQVTNACDASGNPTVTFTWQNNASTETGFWLDVSHDAFTGPSSTTVSPSVWGVKGVTSSAPAGTTIQFIWNNLSPTTNTQGILDSGDADSAVAGNQLAPERGLTYYWRVTAFSASQQSNHIYPTATTVPPGIQFTSKNCMFDLQVTNNPAGNTQVYDPGAAATFSVQVTNTTAAQVAYPGGGVLGAWTQSNMPSLNCDPTRGALAPVTPAPNPPTNTVQSIAIPPLAIGASTIITLSAFNTSAAPGSYLANFYALPNCTPNNDSNWSNNGFQLVYVVSAKTWFQTVGGDVGARGKIQVSNTSVPVNSQSTAVLAGNPLDSSVQGKWELNNYTGALFPPDNSGVYNYFASRFRSKATDNLCTINSANLAARPGNDYIYCTSDVTAGGDLSAIAGNNNWVVFVDGNLTVNANLIMPAGSTLVFVVKGNITVNTAVTEADGVYITGGTFADYDNVGTKSRNTSPYNLTIKGAVYAHAFDLSSFLSNQPGCVSTSPSCNNATTPTDYVVFQPTYLVQLSQMIGSPAVSWQEVAP